MKKAFHHLFNSLHLYCRLVEWNIMTERKAWILCLVFDKLTRRIMYPLLKKD